MHNNYFPNIPYLSPERSQKFFGIILTLLAIIFFGFFAIKPTVSTILQLQKEKKDNEYVLSQLEAKIKNLTGLRKQYFDLRNDLPITTNAITTQPDAHVLFAQIQSIAKDKNIILQKLQNFEVEILKANANKDYYSFNFNLAGTGSLDNIVKFIQTLTNMERIINIEIFSINNLSNENLIGFEAQGTAFFKNNP